MAFLELAHERYSCRKFNDKPVEQDKIDKIIEAALAAPTAVNKQPFKIWVIKDASAIEKLAQITPFTFGAKVIFAVGASESEAWNRPFDKKSFADIDGSIVATHMMLEIQNLGLGTTWVGYFDEKNLIDNFPQMEGYNIVALFPTGYPANDVEISEMHYISKNKEEIVSYI